MNVSSTRRFGLLRVGAFALVAALGVGVGSGSALAHPGEGSSSEGSVTRTPAQIAAHASRKIFRAGAETAHDLRRIAGGGIRQVLNLRRNSADPAAIAAAVDAAVVRLTTRATAGLTRVETIKADAVTRIGTGEGSAAALATLETAASTATTRINDAKATATTAVNNAVTSTLPRRSSSN